MLTKVTSMLVALLLFLAPAVTMADHHNPSRIMPAEAMKRMNAGEKITIIDVQTKASWDMSKIILPNAVHVGNNEDLKKITRELSKEEMIVIYCT